MRAAAGLLKSKTLSVRERLSGRLFLADSGADVSVFPATESDKLASEGSCSLRAANGTGIMTYGTSTRHLDFPGANLKHKFVLADVTRPLLGANFFEAHGITGLFTLSPLPSPRQIRLPPTKSSRQQERIKTS